MQAANADYWDQEVARWRHMGLPSAQETSALMGQLGCSNGDRILDAGCGSGRWSVALARQGCRVLGLDVSRQSVDVAKELARESGINLATIAFGIGDLGRTSFNDSHFDAVLCRNVLDFVPAPGGVLAEFWRIVRPGGHLVVAVLGAASVVKREDWRRFLREDPTPWIRNQLLPWEAEALLRATGWHILDQFGSFGPSVAGAANPYTAELAERLQDRILQQTIASSWSFVAEKS